MNALIAAASRLAPNLSPGMFVVYFLRLQSGIVYIGASADLLQRLDDHSSGCACRTTKRDQPLELVRIEFHATFTQARSREAQLKRWSRSKKEALIRGEIADLRSLSQSHDHGKNSRKSETHISQVSVIGEESGGFSKSQAFRFPKNGKGMVGRR